MYRSAGQVERGLEGAVLAGTAVTAVDDGADLERAAASEAARLGDEPAAGPSDEVEPVRAAGDTLDERGGSREASTSKKSPDRAQ